MNEKWRNLEPGESYLEGDYLYGAKLVELNLNSLIKGRDGYKNYKDDIVEETNTYTGIYMPNNEFDGECSYLYNFDQKILLMLSTLSQSDISEGLIKVILKAHKDDLCIFHRELFPEMEDLKDSIKTKAKAEWSVLKEILPPNYSTRFIKVEVLERSHYNFDKIWKRISKPEIVDLFPPDKPTTKIIKNYLARFTI